MRILLAVCSALLLAVSSGAAQESPAARRLMDAVRAANANAERMKTFIDEAYAPGFRSIAPDEVHVAYLAQLNGRQVDPAAISSSSPRRAAVAVANELTEETDSIIVELDEANRIARLRYRAGVGTSTGTFASDEARVAQLRRYIAKLAAADRFSGVVLFAKNGNVLLHEAYGIANKDFGVPNRLDTKFNLGSANKNFTAVVIGQLVEEGKLSWDDPLSRFLPDFPDSASARKVLIKHLLTHTSGLGSYFNRKFVESSRARFRTVDQMMELARPDSLRFEPGTAWSYSNTGYLVLGKVIEVVEGRSYFDVVQDRIYNRVGMIGSGSFELDHVNPNLAVGYSRVPGPHAMEFRNNIFEHVIRGGPAGGGYSTAPDLFKYAEALRGGRLIKRTTLDLMRSPKPELNSPRYGYGFVLFEGPDIWGHGGDFEGIDFDLNQYGDSGYTLILMANYNGVNPPLLRKVNAMMRGAGAVAGR